VPAKGFTAVSEGVAEEPEPELDPRFEGKGCDLLSGMLRTSPATVQEKRRRGGNRVRGEGKTV
jgi:hypothetical protein